MKPNIYKTTKRIFYVCLVLTLICIHSASTAQEPKRIALLPFKVNAEKDMSFLQNGIFDMLTSRLSSAGQVEVLDRREAENAVESIAGARPLDENLARKIGKQLNADFVLIGSLTVFGNSISIDSKMVDVNSTRPTMTFFDQSQDLGAVITKINIMAADINANLFGRVAVAKPTPPQPKATQTAQAPAAQGQVQAKQSDQTNIHAHPEKLLESSRPDTEGAQDLSVGEAQQVYQNFWRSPSFSHLINGVAVGDVDGDKQNETIVITPHSVLIYRSEKGRFFKIHEAAKEKLSYFIGVDVADINANGVAEIFVTSLNNQKNEALSFVLEYDGKDFNKTVKRSGWFYRVAELPSRGKILLGQKHKSGKPFSGDIFEMAWQNSDYDPLNEIKTPRRVSLMGLTLGPVVEENQETAVAFKPDDRIELFDESGKEIWTSAEYYGGSMLFYNLPKTEVGDIEVRLYFPARLVIRKNKTTSSEVITVRNHDMTSGKLDFRKFTQSHIESLSWNGLGLTPNWKTRQITGYISDFAVGDFDNDGSLELVAAVILKEGSIAFTKPKSTLIVYELES